VYLFAARFLLHGKEQMLTAETAESTEGKWQRRSRQLAVVRRQFFLLKAPRGRRVRKTSRRQAVVGRQRVILKTPRREGARLFRLFPLEEIDHLAEALLVLGRRFG
jgi:hypothetical protein